MKPLRIGLYGGSFDPPHNAHLTLARLARDQLGLDELVLVPAGQPWQKADRAMAPPADRAAMLRAMIDGEPGMRVDECELKRTGPSYTLDTVLELQARPEYRGAGWFLVLGQDQYARLHTWHRWQDLLARVTLAVAGRDGEQPKPSTPVAAVPHQVQALPMPAMPLSSSDVRERIDRGQSIAEVVPPGVARYIDRTHLYRS
ncbi:nicotinate-nucleotide adenylyltransferase [Ideonella sp. BN130291]|uniref:nicotinate-nucleotide adenylyltransferase n=1 Tax=Ideonella sp. BN130291 TaxID=3112940 RepID=UPI002E271BA1|nr:nicotinate-nucleotide adenylyltransferase [Ideonella sp. BN130291]